MKKEEQKLNSKLIDRPPVVAVMGHIDHGKSKLLDYIRKSNVVDKEKGGITQHISAYEVIHKNEDGVEKKITFLDTPGHESFSAMRKRGIEIADIVILVISAEDGPKNQTFEILKTIEENKIPYLVAINKIDKPNINVQKTKMDLAEKGIYLEGQGGTIPYVEISAKTGQGINTLLDTILLIAEMEELKGNPLINAIGKVLESDLNPQRGISANLIIKDGILKKGDFIVIGDSVAGTRIFENFLGENIEGASFSSPVRITGFSSSLKILGFRKVPKAGDKFISFNTKQEAENLVKENQDGKKRVSVMPEELINTNTKIIPLIIKADVSGSIEAIEKEILKLNNENISFKIIQKEVGNINESDLSLCATNKNSIVIGFNVKADSNAIELEQRLGITMKLFDIIYQITDWLKNKIEELTPKKEIEEVVGKIKVLRIFNQTKGNQTIGGEVIEGKITSNKNLRIIRRENQIGTGRIISLEQNKTKTKIVEEGRQFGTIIETKTEIAIGDILESFIGNN